jgi:type 1 glutamine amidotransferase
MGDHPISWCRGRAFYTALGHGSELWARSWYRRYLLGGIRTAAGQVRADCFGDG